MLKPDYTQDTTAEQHRYTCLPEKSSTTEYETKYKQKTYPFSNYGKRGPTLKRITYTYLISYTKRTQIFGEHHCLLSIRK